MPTLAIITALCSILLLCLPGFVKEIGYTARNYSYVIVASYPHDPTAFTQGLAMDSGSVYEGTGLLGSSSLRRVALQTGKVEHKIDCDNAVFGEGITVLGDSLFQLTWKNRQAFVYNKQDFSLQRTFEYPRQGWGLTHDNVDLIAGDGTSTLYFLDPKSLNEKKRLIIHDDNQDIPHLNELEYIKGKIYANIYKSDRIAIINPGSGLVEGWINLAGLRSRLHLNNSEAVLNGIMYDETGDKLYVTGKLWPTLFQIKLTAE
jgi:glutaminyl-peptide cyclotransferase